jgi:predicted PurR-regulated permease PerM
MAEAAPPLSRQRIKEMEGGSMTDQENPSPDANGAPAPIVARTPAAGGVGTHVRTAGSALFNWGRATLIDGLCVAVLWFIGLELLHVALAPFWALIAGLMAFIPNIGGVISLLGPVFAILLSGHDMDRLLFVLGLYGVIVVIDQLLLQPLILKRVSRVPIWASLLVPIVLGIVIPFWGVLLAPPLLAVVYAFRKPKTQV